MIIQKTVTNSYNILQVSTDFLVFNEQYRRIRGGARYKGFQCFSCNHKFEDGEHIGLIITNKGNKVVCQTCAHDIKNEPEGKVNE